MTTEFVRSGECNRCGDCCKGDPFNGTRGVGRVQGYCPLYRIVHDKGHCADRNDPYYLMGCNIWPTHPDQIADKPNCSYVFTPVITNGS